jgi:hypothetical protein
MKLTDPDKPWTLDVSQKNFQTNAALIQCQGKNGYNGDVISERLWIVTRLHSPLGYPTDPIICGGKLGKCEDLTWLFRVECMPDYGPEYRGSVSKTKSGIYNILPKRNLASIMLYPLLITFFKMGYFRIAEFEPSRF